MTVNAGQGNWSLRYAKRGGPILSSEVYSLEADPMVMTSRREEIDVCMSSSDSVGEPYMRCRLEDNYIPRLSYKFLQEPPERILLLLVAVSRDDAHRNSERASHSRTEGNRKFRSDACRVCQLLRDVGTILVGIQCPI